MASYNVLLLGLGFWGSNWIRAITGSDNCRLTGIAGADEDIKRLSAELDLSSCEIYTDFHTAIEKADADIAVIALPTALHVEAAKSALARGLNVICEKPLAPSMEQARDLLKAKRQYPDQKLLVSQNYRWRPHIQTMRTAVQDGLIGQIGSLHVEFRRPEDLIGYRTDLEMPLLQDVCIHHFDLIRYLTGKECREIYAHSYHPHWSQFTGESSTDAILLMDNDFTASYSGTWAARGKETSWEGNITITGDKGCLTNDPENRIWYFQPGDSQGKLLENVQMKHTEISYALHTLADCIENAKEPETSVEDNCQSLALVFAAEESARTGNPVKV